MSIEAKRGWNWMLWVGFALSLVAFTSYFFLFVQFPSTRNFPSVNLALFALAGGLLTMGLRRAFRHPEMYHGKVFGPILAGLSVLVTGLFIFSVFVVGRQMPASSGAPHVGAKAPDFTLLDTARNPVSLESLLTQPLHGVAPKGVMLVFYRGYW
jgi:MFS family permease